MQVRGLHTFIRNKDTPRDEFIFYSKRLIRLVIEYALSLLPFHDLTVDTPQGVPYEGWWNISIYSLRTIRISKRQFVFQGREAAHKEYAECLYWELVKRWNKQFVMYVKIYV